MRDVREGANSASCLTAVLVTYVRENLWAATS